MTLCYGWSLAAGDVVIVIDHARPLAVILTVIEVPQDALGDTRSARWESTDGTTAGHSDYFGADLVERVACCGDRWAA